MAVSPKPQASSRTGVHFAAGLVTGVVSAALLQPADLLKTRLQQDQHTRLASTLREMTRDGPSGLRQLWRGTFPSVIRTGLGSALYFTSLNAIRRAIAQAGGTGMRQSSSASTSALPRLSPTANLFSGAFARTAAGMVLMPLTVLKVRFESDLYAYTSLRRAARGVWQTEGLRGFFAGVGATALRDAPYAGLYVLFYEQAKSSLSEQLNNVRSAAAGMDGSGAAFVMTSGRQGSDTITTRVSAPVNFLSGMVAGAAATAVTNPFDAVKTRLQLRPKEYPNLWKATSAMVTNEGVRSLFDGLALRMTRKAMSSAIAWTLYEELVRLAEARV